MVRISLLAALLALRLQEAGEAERRIDELGDPDVEVRDRAQGRLLEMGPSILPALRRAASHEDAEIRCRAREVVEDLERLERERAHDAVQRKTELETDPPDPGKSPPPTARTDGITFAFVKRGSANGTVLTTFAAHKRSVQVDYEVARVTDESGRELALERCERCGPRQVLVKHQGTIRPFLKGTRLWFSPYTLEWKAPRAGESRKAGDFTISVDWPWLSVECRRDWPPEVLGQMEPWFVFKGPGDAASHTGFVARPAIVERPRPAPRDHPGWCSRLVMPEPPDAKTHPSPRGILYERIRIEDVESIQYRFLKPVEESFEVEGPWIWPKPAPP